MIRKILVYTYGDHAHDHTIEAAAKFAKQNDAELTGLFVKPDIMALSGVYGAYPVDLSQQLKEIQNNFAEKNKKLFEQITDKYQCRSQWHEVSEYQEQPNSAFYTDYIFVSQPKADGQAIFNDSHFINRIISETGLPVVLIPENWSANALASTPLFGWKESREAIAAFHHTESIMSAAKMVDVVEVNKPGNADTELVHGIEICDFLSAHEIKCEYFSETKLDGEQRESQALLRHQKKSANDAIIIGAYSHSRLREIILGGMTRDLIRNSPVPLILAH